MDSYLLGGGEDVAFLKQVGFVAGNGLKIATASGETLHDLLPHQSLKDGTPGLLSKYGRLDREQRVKIIPKTVTPTGSKGPRQKVRPEFPDGGLVVRGYSMLPETRKPRENRTPESGLLWLTKEEKESLIPEQAKKGEQIVVSKEIQRRLFGTLAIDYSEGNAPALKIRDSRLELVVTNSDSEKASLTLSGRAELGEPFDRNPTKSQPRGCQIWVHGRLEVDCESKSIENLRVVGIGQAWGRMWPKAGRVTHLGERFWDYSIVWELASQKRAVDRIPPYNLLHYSDGDYWGKR